MKDVVVPGREKLVKAIRRNKVNIDDHDELRVGVSHGQVAEGIDWVSVEVSRGKNLVRRMLTAHIGKVEMHESQAWDVEE